MSDDVKTTKVCSKCNEEQLIENFHKTQSTKDGRNTFCKECKNTKARLKNNEKLYKRRNHQRCERIKAGVCERCGDSNLLENTRYCEEHYIRTIAVKTLGSGKINIIKELKNKLEKQPNCPYTGKKLILGKNAGLDHIVPVSIDKSLFSNLNNVEWVDREVNRIKNNLTKNDFIQFCKDVYKYHLQTKDERIEKFNFNFCYNNNKIIVSSKICIECNVLKSVSSFRKNKFCKDGFRAICKECHKKNKSVNLSTRDIRLKNGLCSHCDNELLKTSNLFCELHAVYSQANQTLHDGTMQTAQILLENLYKYPYCPYTGKKLILGVNASLDHIKSSRNFPELKKDISNIEWVDNNVNKIKNFLNKEDFIKLCKTITKMYPD